MALSFFDDRRASGGGPILQVEKLDVYYGRAHVLQGVSLALDHGVLAVVGRNGMGKSTLCNALTGLVPGSGSVRLAGAEILGLPPNQITDRGIAYVPQGRRIWPSLSVDEHLRLAQRSRKGPWTVSRIYQMFPRLGERKTNGGAQLSGGEQQMLAIGRALMTNPRLLILDEATEGLAPLVRAEIWQCLKSLKAAGQSILLIDKNVEALIRIADRHYVIERGRVVWTGNSGELAASPAVQHRYLGI